MSGSRTKKVREAFESVNGFKSIHRDKRIYKHEWRIWKKNMRMA